MRAAVRSAIVLAAGCGTRLRRIVGDRPKGLMQLGDTTPMDRSLDLLARHGIESVTIVAGFEADWYRTCASHRDGVRVVGNPSYATTGSMQSLHCGLAGVTGDFLLLESDLVYETRALARVLGHEADNVVLASGPTGATDEVWVDAPGLRLRGLSKDRGRLGDVAGEFVGICRVSALLASEMDAALARFVARHGHARMDYETEALVQASATLAVHVDVVPDLLWGEIDHEAHYRRVTTDVYPAILAQERRDGRG